MAKKKAVTKATETFRNKSGRIGRPIRLELSDADHARLGRVARRAGLPMAAYARMAVKERMKADEVARRAGREAGG